MFEKRNIYSLILEFVLIISGVLISLFFQSKYEERQQEEEGFQILNQVRSDLKLDTALLASNIDKINYLMDQYIRLLKKKSDAIVGEEMPGIVEGILATDTKVVTLLNRGGYLRFSSFGNYELYHQPELINSILHYYTNQNELLANYYRWDDSYVENKVVDYYRSHHTGNLLRYFEQSVFGEDSKKEDAVMMQTMIADPEFQSLVVYNYIIKKNYKAQLEKAKEEAEGLIKKLENSLKGRF